MASSGIRSARLWRGVVEAWARMSKRRACIRVERRSLWGCLPKACSANKEQSIFVIYHTCRGKIRASSGSNASASWIFSVHLVQRLCASSFSQGVDGPYDVRGLLLEDSSQRSNLASLRSCTRCPRQLEFDDRSSYSLV